MGYATIIYLLIGLILVIVKSPIRELVDKEISKIEIHNLVYDQEIPRLKFLLFRLVISAVLIIIYPIMLFADLKEKRDKQKTNETNFNIKPEAHISWLRENISVKEAESKNSVEIKDNIIPFGYRNEQWKNLLSQMKKGDELYEFCSPDESWESLAGRAGIALVRNGKIIADIITVMN